MYVIRTHKLSLSTALCVNTYANFSSFLWITFDFIIFKCAIQLLRTKIIKISTRTVQQTTHCTYHNILKLRISGGCEGRGRCAIDIVG
jgi:hypothetical protein